MKAALIRVGVFVASIETVPADKKTEETGRIKLPEPLFYQKLSEAAERLGIDLFVFSPNQYNKHTKQLTGFRFRSGSWAEEQCLLPDILYDRCFYKQAAERAACQAVLAAIREQHPIRSLSGSLPAKWEVYNALRQFPKLLPLLPQTTKVDQKGSLARLITHHGKDIFLKPSAGMQGRGAMRIRFLPLSQQWEATGRTRKNLPFHRYFEDYSALTQWITTFIGHASYIAQPYLHLIDQSGNPFDLRVLVQKDGHGRWGITGTAVRIGLPDSVTSNLHGGGTASETSKQLSHLFGSAKAQRMINKIQDISIYTAERLENSFGRLAELGLDFGIEPDGRNWLLEVNAKPGRSSFQQFRDHLADQLSVEMPLRYARMLTQRSDKPFVINDSATAPILVYPSDKRIRSDNVQEVHP
ncbi:YheC/YheD family endospore coat-associated protein [Paenibacillus sp. YAF4_2]|uniref:YheC/YheD family endospore coat-associated protein n=1 Tax=Paenibacillus sp. YAF4_2 TaxID=3233085 RepID=UPI003F967F91